MRNALVLLGCISLVACDSGSTVPRTPDAATCPTSDATTPAMVDAGMTRAVDSGAKGMADASRLDAGSTRAGRCNAPLDCSRSSCPDYHPLVSCPEFGQVREGSCGLGDELRFRVSFDGGGEFIEYWELETGKLVGIDHGSDVLDFCGETSARIVLGDLERIEACEASRGMQQIVCPSELDDAGEDDAGS